MNASPLTATSEASRKAAHRANHVTPRACKVAKERARYRTPPPCMRVRWQEPRPQCHCNTWLRGRLAFSQGYWNSAKDAEEIHEAAVACRQPDYHQLGNKKPTAKNEARRRGRDEKRRDIFGAM